MSEGIQQVDTLFIHFFKKRFCLFIFRERGGEGEKEGEKHQCVVASHVPPTGNLGHNPGMCSYWELNQRLFDSQTSAQSTEPHQRGPHFVLCCQFSVEVLRLVAPRSTQPRGPHLCTHLMWPCETPTGHAQLAKQAFYGQK